MRTIGSLITIALLVGVIHAGDEFPVKKVLTLQAAMKAASAAQAEAAKRGATVVIAFVDDGGHLILLHRLDDTQVASVEVGICLSPRRLDASAIEKSPLLPGRSKGPKRKALMSHGP